MTRTARLPLPLRPAGVLLAGLLSLALLLRVVHSLPTRRQALPVLDSAAAAALEAAGGDQRMVAALRYGLPFRWDAQAQAHTQSPACPESCLGPCDEYGCLACPEGAAFAFGDRVFCTAARKLCPIAQALPDASHQADILCAPGCQIYDPSRRDCLECLQPYSLMVDRSCEAFCPINCQMCTQSGCSSCEEGFYLDYNACYSCPEECTHCSSPSLCSSCSQGHFHHSGQCGCLSSCPPNFHDAGGACSPCSANCTTCTSVANCTACSTGHHLLDGACVDQCPSGTFDADTAPAQCLACHPLCQECAGPGSSDCTACDPPLVIRQPIPPVEPPLAVGQCVPDCLNDPSQCAECEDDCVLCRKVPDEEGSFCLECRDPLVSLDGRCVAACPPGHGLPPGSGYCTRCSSSCGDSCFGPASNQCQSCPPGRFLQAGECRDACSAVGWFQSSSTGCSRCHASCSQCTGPGPDQCVSCPRGSYRLPAPEGGFACMATCPAGHFADIPQAACRPCAADCATCDHPHVCLTCRTPEWLLLPQGGCAAACPAGMAPTSDEPPACVACEAGCAECEAAPGQPGPRCLRCDPGLVLLQTGVCAGTCPARQFDDAGACAPCQPECAGCRHAAGHCTACSAPGARLRPDAGQCVDTCPPGEAPPANDATLCRACHAHCAGCLTADDAHACDACPPGRYLAQGACLEACPDGTYPEEGLCLACDSSCARCSGPGPGSCLACRLPDRVLLTGRCVARCPDAGYWLDTAQAKCRPCVSGCMTCNRAACTVCQAGLALVTGPQPACVAVCPGGFFEDVTSPAPDARVCLPCAEGCHTCTGPAGSHCQATWCQFEGTCSRSARSVAIGVGVGVTVLLLLLLAAALVLFSMWRQRQAAGLAKTDINDDDDRTVMNTLVDLAVPGFLLFSLNEDVRLADDQQVGAGAQARILDATAVTPALADRARGAPLVLKMLHPAGTPGALPAEHAEIMFRNELSIIWALQASPNIVRLIGYTSAPSALILGREPTDLNSLLDRGEPVALEDARALLRGMFAGLAFIHAEGVAHRDIKSQNILVGVSTETGRMRPLFTDFGVSVAVSRGSALLDSVLPGACSVFFAAPEILSNLGQTVVNLQAVSHLAADVYSLASVAWHLLTHQHPWNGLAHAAVAAAVLHHQQRPDSHGPQPVLDLDDPLIAWALDMLPSMWHSDPAQRPQAASLAAACQAAP
ncbi:serine/threonine protein kinase [Fonticula alba]|uniref:Serine/threonine protein kinase n=1 Tax=Fonticula alba TaxID=691883 RepID=A0A058Z4P4_FONAL|nr:serine/threonine protein kinase [Fonticula alba]KCV69245.1 serine/threonine protein kinase [Fonticula alba]|eukprot:XP_009496816.1 serine/threonine protein kinase [Fonticula alba]